MNIIAQINMIFDDFSDEKCRAHNGYDPEWRPTWNDDVEKELNRILANSPIQLPQDYCEIFRAFGGGSIADERMNRVIPIMTFWTWDDIAEFDLTVDFFQDCPNALPFGDDMGDVVYLMIQDKVESGIYMSGKSVVWDANFRYKVADSFTDLFYNAEAQRKLRNYYQYGKDKGLSGW